MSEELGDPQFLISLAPEVMEPELAQKLMNSEFGRGYFMGLLAMYLAFAEGAEEDDDDL